MSAPLAPGTLLLSAPEMTDPNFMHTVVLMVHHDEEGAMGVVVNRPMGTTVADALPRHPLLGEHDAALWQGGPVGLDSMQVLHLHPGGPAPDAPGVDLGDGIRIGASLGWATEAIGRGEGDASRLRFVLGYSGWSAGQLEAEIATYSWLPLAAAADLVFAADDRQAVWRRAMARLAGGGPSLAHLPPDPSWN